jgi:hypothetical protein
VRIIEMPRIQSIFTVTGFEPAMEKAVVLPANIPTCITPVHVVTN